MSTEGLVKTTIGDFLDATAEKFPRKHALIFTDYYSPVRLRYTWRRLQEECNRLAKGFMRIGVKKGDHIAIWATSYPEWVFTQFAAAKIGAVLVTINPEWKAGELEYALKQSDSQTLVLIEGFQKTSATGKVHNYNYLDILYELCPEVKNSRPGHLKSSRLPKLKNVVLISYRNFPGMFTLQEITYWGEREISDDKLMRRQKSVKCDDVAMIQYTSGTTGFPKGAMLTHFNVVNNAIHIAQNLKFTHRDRLCVPVPYYHCFGSVVSNLCCLVTGVTMVVPAEYFDPEKTLRAIQEERCTIIYGVPTMFIAELEHPDFDKFDLSSLRAGMMAGAPCPIVTMQDVVNKMGAEQMTIAYGLTETSPVTHQTLLDDTIERRVTTVGKPISCVEAKIVDPQTLQEVPLGVQGEIWVRGYNVMKGYYEKPKETAETILKDGWLRTGDLGTKDEQGYYKITGRLKNMIIRGGENIYPREIEEFLFTHPDIVNVQVVGVPSRKFGQEVAACIKLREGAVLTEKEIKEFCRKTIAFFKVPTYVKFVDEFPTTVSGKVRKIDLVETLIKELGLEEEAKIETA